jgi:hypothetical protein
MPCHGPLFRMSSALKIEMKGLGHRIVEGIAAGAHRGHRASLGEPFGVPNRDVLHAAVGMVHQRREVVALALASPDSHI